MKWLKAWFKPKKRPDLGDSLSTLDESVNLNALTDKDITLHFRRVFLRTPEGRRVLRQILGQCGIYGIRDGRGALVRSETMSDAELRSYAGRLDVGFALAETVFSPDILEAFDPQEGIDDDD